MTVEQERIDYKHATTAHKLITHWGMQITFTTDKGLYQVNTSHDGKQTVQFINVDSIDEGFLDWFESNNIGTKLI